MSEILAENKVSQKPSLAPRLIPARPKSLLFSTIGLEEALTGITTFPILKNIKNSKKWGEKSKVKKNNKINKPVISRMTCTIHNLFLATYDAFIKRATPSYVRDTTDPRFVNTVYALQGAPGTGKFLTLNSRIWILLTTFFPTFYIVLFYFYLFCRKDIFYEYFVEWCGW